MFHNTAFATYASHAIRQQLAEGRAEIQGSHASAGLSSTMCHLSTGCEKYHSGVLMTINNEAKTRICSVPREKSQ